MEQLIRRCKNFSKLQIKKAANSSSLRSRREEMFSRPDSRKTRPSYTHGIFLPLLPRKVFVEFFNSRRFLLSANVFSFWSWLWIVHNLICLIMYNVHNCLYAYLNIEEKSIKETDTKNPASSKVTWNPFWPNLILFQSSNVAKVPNKCQTIALLVVYISRSVHIFIIPSPSSFWGL